MRAIILYSKHEESREKVEDIKVQLTNRIESVDVIEVYGTEVGMAIKNILNPSSYPCVVFIPDYLQGDALNNIEYFESCIEELTDINEREVHKRETDFLGARLQQAKLEGKAELDPIIDDMASLLLENGII